MSVDTSMKCARHPSEETAVTCANCGTPVCTKCMVYTPVGVKCPDCGLSKNLSLFSVRPERLLLAGFTAIIAGAFAAFVGSFGFFLIAFFSFPYGYFIGDLVVKVSGRKHGRKLEAVTGLGMIAGAAAIKLLPAIVSGKPVLVFGQRMLAFGSGSLLDPVMLITVIIATACAVSRIRYI